MKFQILIAFLFIGACNTPRKPLENVNDKDVSHKRYFFCNYDWKSENTEYMGDVTIVTDSCFFSEQEIINYEVSKNNLDTSSHKIIISGLFEFKSKSDFNDFRRKADTIKPVTNKQK